MKIEYYMEFGERSSHTSRAFCLSVFFLTVHKINQKIMNWFFVDFFERLC